MDSNFTFALPGSTAQVCEICRHFTTQLRLSLVQQALDLASNLLTATTVYLEFRDKISWRFKGIVNLTSLSKQIINSAKNEIPLVLLMISDPVNVRSAQPPDPKLQIYASSSVDKRRQYRGVAPAGSVT